MEAILIESLERSVYPLVFGAVHALLLDSLGVQTIVLGIIELCYLSARIYALRSVTSKYRFKVSMFLVSSLMRMGFILTFYLYESTDHPQLMDTVHYDMVWIYIICWIVQLFHDILIFISDIF